MGAKFVTAAHLTVLAWLAIDLAYVLLVLRGNNAIRALGVTLLVMSILAIGSRVKMRFKIGARTSQGSGREVPSSWKKRPAQIAKLFIGCLVVAPAVFIAATSPIPVWLSVPVVAGLALIFFDVASEGKAA
ncbi:MAG: hypothetical protein F9K47_18095 [Burkholderiales bacterium]|nr:MAG: hypothetical protein F9K47_18095 [Burkholderiales bacterium]